MLSVRLKKYGTPFANLRPIVASMLLVPAIFPVVTLT